MTYTKDLKICRTAPWIWIWMTKRRGATSDNSFILKRNKWKLKFKREKKIPIQAVWCTNNFYQVTWDKTLQIEVTNKYHDCCKFNDFFSIFQCPSSIIWWVRWLVAMFWRTMRRDTQPVEKKCIHLWKFQEKWRNLCPMDFFTVWTHSCSSLLSYPSGS